MLERQPVENQGQDHSTVVKDHLSLLNKSCEVSAGDV